MLRASLPREPVAITLAMPWMSSLAHDRQSLALGGQELLEKLTQKNPLHFAKVGLSFYHEGNYGILTAKRDCYRGPVNGTQGGPGNPP